MKKEELYTIAANVLKKNEVNISKSQYSVPLKQLHIDSLKTMQIIIDVEEKVGKQLDSEVLMNIKTIDEMVDYFSKITA
ncbi:hypothetical protein FACS189459_6860 [Bacilli bacterium]|nr:hypothetical protein FACS189459_6860 [Bacilli bacterium]